MCFDGRDPFCTPFPLRQPHLYTLAATSKSKRYLVPLARGALSWELLLSPNPTAGSDAGGTKTTAVLDGEEWLVNGSKIFTTNGGDADTYIVFARTDKEAEKASRH